MPGLQTDGSREAFLALNHFGLSANQLAKDIDLPPGRITEIIKGKRATERIAYEAN